MKTLLRKDIHNTIDFEGTRIDTADERSNSITGDSLNILSKINANIHFTGSRYSYSDNFLISNDILYHLTAY